jgi:hypothetical protein
MGERLYRARDDAHERQRCINALERISDQIARASRSEPEMRWVKAGWGNAMVEVMVDDRECIPQCRRMIKIIEARMAEIGK